MERRHLCTQTRLRKTAAEQLILQTQLIIGDVPHNLRL